MTETTAEGTDSFTGEERIKPGDLPELEPGSTVAVRSIDDGYQTVFTGYVDEVLAGSPETAFEYHDVDRSPDPPSYAPAIYIQGDTVWSIDDEEISDSSHLLCDRPPYQPHLGDDPKEPPLCSLAYGTDGTVALSVPTPTSNGKRIIYYNPGFRGEVVEIMAGLRVTPDQVLPDGYERPD